MPSQYDDFWKSVIGDIETGIRKAMNKGESVDLEISGIKNFGNRKSWYGTVEVSPQGIEGGEMAHAMSLVKIFMGRNIIEGKKIKFTISNSLKLTIEIIEEVNINRETQKTIQKTQFALTKSQHETFQQTYKGEKENKKKIICFIPCCSSKNASGDIIEPPCSLSEQDLTNSWNNLLMGRQIMQDCIDTTYHKTSAISLYKGSPYNVLAPHRKNILESIHSARLRLIIVSAGYGIIDALEPIHNYEAEMKGRIASHWRNNNLIGVISDFLLHEQPARLYGFFAGKKNWSTSGAKYRYFFTEGLKSAQKKGLNIQSSGCFYRKEGMGVKAILGSLGRTFIELLRSDFNDSFVEEIIRNDRRDGNVKIGFDLMSR